MTTDENNESGDACPYCGSKDSCDHLLLLVDVTFRSAEGGLLRKVFNQRWSHICEEHEEDVDFDERGPFEEILEEVDSLSDAMNEYDNEGAPGMSSSYAIYYVSSPARAEVALRTFETRSVE
jgi:hypothetical protein